MQFKGWLLHSIPCSWLRHQMNLNVFKFSGQKYCHRQWIPQKMQSKLSLYISRDLLVQLFEKTNNKLQLKQLRWRCLFNATLYTYIYIYIINIDVCMFLFFSFFLSFLSLSLCLSLSLSLCLSLSLPLWDLGICGCLGEWFDVLSSAMLGGTQRCGTEVCHASWSQHVPCELMDQHPRLLIVI
jgi:hypothetical protein